MITLANTFMTVVAEADMSSLGAVLPRMILIAVGIGLLAGFIHAISLKSALTSVRKNDTAADYEREGSFVVERQSDNFVYSTTERKEKPTSNNS